METEKTTVTIPKEAAALLVAEAVDRLWNQWATCEEHHGCCPKGCCAACYALRKLLDTGQLDELYGWYVDNCGGGGPHATWDYDKRQVNRTWLLEAWSAPMTCDHTEDGG